jgi:ATPase components of various ABC-type transport systems, contain duplicated ATPase
MNSVIELENVTKIFTNTQGIIRRKKKRVYALHDVNLSIGEKEILGLIGESGSGKTTLGLAVLRLLDLEGGRILFKGKDILSMDKREIFKFREKTEMIFQDPYGSLNPVQSVYKIISTPYKVFNKNVKERDVIEKVMDTLEMVGLTPPEQYLAKYPNQLSGGQRQRVGIARAIITNPEFLVADEPVSMLDVSLRADVLNILLELRSKLGTSILFISHDIAVTQYVSDRIAVMHLGQIVEIAESTELVNNPLHPYTQTLINSIPIPDPKRNGILLSLRYWQENIIMKEKMSVVLPESVPL